MAKTTVSEAEEIELEFKRLQIEIMRDQINSVNDKKSRSAEQRERAVVEFKKGQAIVARIQARCQHKKGGRDNRFAKGNDANYAVITNTYPFGEICVSCTRCGKEVWRPDKKLKKDNPELYATMMAEYKIWSNYPTDNTPSGSKIFELAS
jgi:hypothetical protein